MCLFKKGIHEVKTETPKVILNNTNLVCLKTNILVIIIGDKNNNTNFIGLT